LDRLELPNKMDDPHLSLFECLPSDLLQTLGPYLGNLVRRRSPEKLKLSAYPDHRQSDFSILVGDRYQSDPAWDGWFVAVDGITSVTLGEEEADKLCFDIIAHIPLEEIVRATTGLHILRLEELCVRMHNLTHLELEQVDLSKWFVEPDTCEPHVFKDLLRGLRSITITESRLSGDWTPFMNFLARRAAVGNRISSLTLGCYPRMGDGVAESIMHVVGVFEEWDYDGH
jgi:hypothetical protein